METEVGRARRGAWWAEHRPRLDDLALIAVTLYASIGSGAVDDQRPDTTVWVGTGLTAAMALALWWRRRAPLALAVAGCVVVALGASPVVLSATLATLAVRRRDRVLVVVAAVAVPAQLLAPSSFGLSVRDDAQVWAAGQLFRVVLFIALPVVLGAFVGARRDLLASLHERAERAEAEQQLRAEQARAAERTRIAREMHDALGHRISLVALHAGGLEVSATSPQVARSAELIRTTAREALQDLREILGVLREGAAEPGVSDAGGAATLQDRAQDLSPQPDLGDVPALVRASAQAGARVRLVDEVLPGAEVPALLGRTAYRVAQEGLTNVHKHAPHAATTVRLSGTSGDALVVEVVNARPTGPPGARGVGSGLGLVGLGERVHLAHGHLEAAAAADGGFAVRARLPWPAGQDGRG